MKAEVMLEDNSFQPKVLVVPKGTTVRWTNRGRHRHAVASDQGAWNSGQLSTGVAYSHTFSRPGVYYYHCDLHPQEMRAIIEVK
jgi:plastocyanin